METPGELVLRSDPSATGNVQVLHDGVPVTINGSTDLAGLTSIAVIGSAGADVIDLSPLDPASLPAGIRISIAAGEGDDSVMGSAIADSISGGNGQDLLIGGSGDDWIDGGEASDSLLGSGGRDTIFGAAGDDRINGNGSSGDVLSGGPGRDTLHGGTGNDYLAGGEDDDWLFGQAGSDRIDGGSENDSIRGGSGKDFIEGGDGDDWLFGQGSAGDSLFGGNGNDLIDGGGGGDFLYGDDGNDSLLGGHGNDRLVAGPGDDILVGGIGDDFLSGESGRDILSGGAGADQIDGGEDEDILIGASTTYDNRHFRWNAIQQTWLSGEHYRTRLESLISPDFATPLRSAETVYDDDFVDSMTGGGGRDWFLEATRECLGPEHLPAEDQLIDRVRTEGKNLSIPYSAESLNAGPGILDLVPHDAVSHTVVANGDWSDPAIWTSGTVPGAGGRIRIPAEFTVTVDRVFSERLDTVRLEGHLRFATDRDTQLAVGTVVTLPSAVFEMGTVADPIQGDATATLLIADHGAIDQTLDPKTIGRGLVAMGRVVMHGSPRTAFAALDGNATTGQTELRFIDGVPADWQIGDQVVIAGTSRSSDDDEMRTILDIQDEVLIIDPVENWHAVPGTTRPTREPLRIHVANLTRNAVIRSESTDLDRRGHVMFMHQKNVDIYYAGFYDLGRTDKKVPLNDAVMDEAGRLVPGTGTNQRARYALHFHRSGVVDDGNPATIHGSVVARSPGWGFVNHGSFVDFTQNVSFDVDGAGFASEAGNEIGSFRNNIAIRGRGSGLKSVNARHELQDFGHQGDGFWLQGAGVIVEDNVAAGQKGHGLIVYTRGLVEFDRQDDTSPLDAPVLFAASNLDFPEIASGQEFVPVHDVPTRDFRRNVAYGSGTGIAPTYINFRPREDHDRPRHDVRGLIEDVTAWNIRVGFLGYYLVNSVVRNATVIGSITNPVSYGIKAHVGSENVTFENSHVEGFAWGFTAPRRGDVQIDGGYFNNLENILVSSIDQSPELDKPVAVQRHHVLIRDVEFGRLPARGLKGRTQIEVILINWFQASECTFRHVLLSESVILDYGNFENQRVWSALQAPDAVPFTEHHVALDPAWVGLTNQQLQDQHGVVFGGAMTPENTTVSDSVFADLGLLFDQSAREASRQPARISPPGE